MTDRPVPQKSADAYRTISEVADELKLPQHVLRFWETRFPQVKPLKRAGGRRFYRPEDVALLRAVQALLYGEGYTIKGVQRLLAEFGARHVADALARSRAAAVSAPERQDDAAGPDRDHGSGSAMPRDEPPSRRDPLIEPPHDPVPPPPAPRPVQSRDMPAPAQAGGIEDIAVRLAGVLADLAECTRLLSSVISV